MCGSITLFDPDEVAALRVNCNKDHSIQQIDTLSAQDQDGTSFGTDSSGNMVRFDQYGNIKWSVPDSPQIATTDWPHNRHDVFWALAAILKGAVATKLGWPQPTER